MYLSASVINQQRNSIIPAAIAKITDIAGSVLKKNVLLDCNFKNEVVDSYFRL